MVFNFFQTIILIFKFKSMKINLINMLLATSLIFAACSEKKSGASITSEEFGKMPDGQKVLVYTLKNNNGLKAKISEYGATLVSLEAPDKEGKIADVILGYSNLDGYLKGDSYYGKTVGRFANRIAKGKFTLDGKEYTLAINNAPNHLHGGPKGYHSVVWKSEVIDNKGYPALKLTYHSPDGEEGYPGNMDIEVVYTWNDDNNLVIDYKAKTDQNTIVNLTHHSLFNLKGECNGDILDHVLTLNASAFTPVDSTLIPTGEIRPVDGTPLDFRTPHAIGERINSDYEQIIKGKGYDHNWVIDRKDTSLVLAATVLEPKSGRVMKVYTTEPGIQFYTGNFIDGKFVGKTNKPHLYRSGLALEAQHYPDSPNQPKFPSVVLKKGEVYTQTTEYRFSIEKN
jgi:aldose 1-epimerase